MMMVLGQRSATFFTTAALFQSASRVVRSEPSVAHVLRKTRQTSGGEGANVEKARLGSLTK